MPARTIVIHDVNGRSQVADYITAIRAGKERAKLMRYLDFIEQNSEVPEHVMKPMKGFDNLWELRVYGHRIIGFYATESQLVLIHAFKKPKEKLQRHEIQVAANRKAEYYPNAR